MKKVLLCLTAVLLMAGTVMAGSVHVKGYYRANGTYVQPYVRSAPNHTTSDNYGPSTTKRSSSASSNGYSGLPQLPKMPKLPNASANSVRELPKPSYLRDYDKDGIPNQFDQDDDNDGKMDDSDEHQYSGKE